MIVIFTSPTTRGILSPLRDYQRYSLLSPLSSFLGERKPLGPRKVQLFQRQHYQILQNNPTHLVPHSLHFLFQDRYHGVWRETFLQLHHSFGVLHHLVVQSLRVQLFKQRLQKTKRNVLFREGQEALKQPFSNYDVL